MRLFAIKPLDARWVAFAFPRRPLRAALLPREEFRLRLFAIKPLDARWVAFAFPRRPLRTVLSVPPRFRVPFANNPFDARSIPLALVR